jgi:hypothetical protein
MHSDMSKETKDQVLSRLRGRYASAGATHKSKLLDQAVELLGYHRKAAIRALRQAQFKQLPCRVNLVLGRPRTYEPERLVPILKPIWFSAFQPCGSRLHALLPEWLPAYELDHRRIDPDLRQCLLQASARTLDRLIGPLRVGLARRGGTRPGSMLRQSIPIRGTWSEEGPGWLEIDTVALCGGRLDDCHLWMLDAVDIRTDWTELRALKNRGQRCTLEQIEKLEASLPFALLGLDSDNGGEFINHHLVAYLGQRPKPVLLTRGRPYKKNDNARVEQRNWTHVRQHFGYERYDNPQVAPMINSLCEGALGQLLNHFLPTHLLKEKRRKAKRIVRVYGPALTPYARVLASQEVSPIKKTQLQQLHQQLNPFALARQIEQQKKTINAQRLLPTSMPCVGVSH